MSLPVHPLLHLVESNANGLKLLLKNYIDFTVDNEFDLLKNSIVQMIATGQIGPQSNYSASEYTQTTFPSGQSIDDTENLPNFHHPNDQLAIRPDQITLPCSSLVSTITTSPVIKQECLDPSSSTIPINVQCNDAPNDEDKEQSNNADIEVNHAQNGQVPIDEFNEVKEEYDDDDDEGEYMSDCAECEDCVKGICGLNGENDDPGNDAHTGLDMDIGLGQDELEDEPNEDNQSTDNANDLSLINQQIRSNQNAIKQNVDNGQSVQPIVENNQQSIGDDQSSGEGKGYKRKCNGNLRKAVKKVRMPNIEGIHQEEEEAKPQVITLQVNCTEDGCKTFSNSVEMWKQHLSFVHGQMPYKHLHDNARQNQHGLTEYPCTECKVVSKLQPTLIKHWRKYRLSGKFECSICAFVGNLWCEVRNHYRNNHRRQTIQCTQEGCNQTFPFMYDLERHQRIHTGETPYRCTWHNCKVSFTQIGTAIQHVRRKHFRLPRTVKKQKELNIIDERDAKVYIQVSRG